MDMLDRFLTGRLKIFSHLSEVFEEIRMYHRENGKVVKIDDDRISAIRYALMMLRFAKLAEPTRRPTSTWAPKDPGMGY